MKKGRFFANIIVLIIVATAVFFIGWMQFHVKPGNCGVLVSKTSGVYEKPIVQGDFTWKWEKLLPTNADLRVFKMEPYSYVQTISGSLPSADIYSKQIKDNPDFTYSITLYVSLSYTPNGIVQMVKKYDTKNQNELEKNLEAKAQIAAKKVIEYFLEKKENDLSFSTNAVTDAELKEIIQKNPSDFENIEIVSVEVKKSKLPDMGLYKKAKESFNIYQDAVVESLKSAAAEQAVAIIEEDRSMERLDKLGKLLQKYPELQDIFKNGDITSILNALRNVK